MASWRAWKPVKENLHLPGLREMLATSQEGECPFCGDAAKRRVMTPMAIAKRAQQKTKAQRSNWFLTCGEPECLSAYHRCHNRDRYGYARPFKKRHGQRAVRSYTRNMSDPSGRKSAP